MYSLRLLGVVGLEGPSGPVSGRAAQRRRLALLALLGSAAEDGGWTRDKLIGLLWPEKSDEQARHLLSDSLYVLRRELGEEAVNASGEILWLDPAVVWIDVAEFEAAIRKGELDEAVSLYRGPFLEGFYLGDGAQLEHWLDAERSRLARLYAKALETLAQQAEGTGNNTSAVEWWQKRAAQDMYDSRIALRLMEAQVAAGNRGAALEHARVHELLIQEEMGADPAPEVLAYAAKLRQQQQRVDLVSLAATADATRAGGDSAGDTSTSPLRGERPVALSRIISQVHHSSRWLVLLLYVGSALLAYLAVQALTKGLRLPDWVPSLAVFALVVFLTVVLATAFAQEGGSRALFRLLLAGATALAAVSAATIIWMSRVPAEAPVAARFTQLTYSGNVGWAEISPDGELLAYAEGGDPGRLLVKDLRGETVIKIAEIGRRVFTLRWSPDGSSLLCVALWPEEVTVRPSNPRKMAAIFPRLGGEPRWLPEKIGSLMAWSPDGSRLAHWYVDSDSIRFTTLATGLTSFISVSDSFTWLGSGGDWSSDGNFIVMPVTVSGQIGLWTVALDGSGWHRLVEDTVGALRPRWSPSSDAVYYFRGDELRKVHVTSGGKARGAAAVLRGGLELGGWGPSLTADGRKLVFVKTQVYSNLWQATPNAPGAVTSFTTVQLTRGTAYKSLPRPSPDGAWIAFTEYRDDQADIFVIPAGGGSPRRATSSGEVASKPVWSPDGRKLAYLVRGEGPRKVRTVAFEGGLERTYEMTAASGDLAWAPGARILYRRPGNRNWHLLDPETEAEESLVPDDSVGFVLMARYSPDGQSVVVHWNRRPNPGLWLISLRDSSHTYLNSPAILPLEWSADGNSVYALDSPRNSYDIFRVPVTGGKTTVVATIPFESEDCTPVERATGLTLLCSVAEVLSDAWMIENFDPNVAVSER